MHTIIFKTDVVVFSSLVLKDIVLWELIIIEKDFYNVPNN